MRICFLLLAAWLVSACQAPLQSGSQCVVEPEYFGHIDTVVWRGENRGFDLQDETGYVSPIVADLLRQAVVAELEPLQREGIAPSGNTALLFNLIRVASGGILALALEIKDTTGLDLEQQENVDALADMIVAVFLPDNAP